jgi:AcrR family transcriptional regulator
MFFFKMNNVHVGGMVMNIMVTSKEEILKNSRELIRKQGWTAVNIRSVAAACGVSVGAIYNYFDSKAALVGVTIESVWCEIFHRPEEESVFRDTQSCIVWMYERMEYGSRQYPGFFTMHSLSFMREDKEDGKRRMQKTWQHILEGLCFVMKRDSKIRPDAFDDRFTAEKFAGVLFSLMLSALLREDYDPGPVLEIVRRTLYEK